MRTTLIFNHLVAILFVSPLCIIIELVSFSSFRFTPSTMHVPVVRHEHRHPPVHDRHADIQEKDLDERMHTCPWYYATELPNVPASNLVQIGIGGASECGAARSRKSSRVHVVLCADLAILCVEVGEVILCARCCGGRVSWGGGALPRPRLASPARESAEHAGAWQRRKRLHDRRHRGVGCRQGRRDGARHCLEGRRWAAQSAAVPLYLPCGVARRPI